MRRTSHTLPMLLVILGACLVLPDQARAYWDWGHYRITGKALEPPLLPPTAPAKVWPWPVCMANGSRNEDHGPGEDHVFCYEEEIFGIPFSANTLPHFWSPDRGIDDLILFGGPGGTDWPNAWMKASGYRTYQFGCGHLGLWPQAIALHSVGNWFDGYERLGHVCHLLQDMSVPAHVHVDFHPSEDAYEDMVSGGTDYLLATLDPAQLSRGRISIPGAEIVKYPFNGTLGWTDLYGLYYLMYTTAQRADCFASEDADGNFDDWYGWASDFYSSELDPLVKDYYRYTDGPFTNRMHMKVCVCSQCSRATAIGGLTACPNHPSAPVFLQWPAHYIAQHYTLVYAVRATATLIALYDNKVYGRIRNTNTLATHSLIQAAIVEASPGDVIEVAPGTYYESIKFFGKAVHVRSTGGPANTEIHGNGNAHVVQCISDEGAGTILEGFTIKGGRALGVYPDNTGAGLLIANSSPTIRNCIFTENAAGSGGGMAAYGYGTNTPTLVNCLFYANTATNWGGGIYADGAIPILNYCTVSSNQAAVVGGGVASANVGGASLTNCIVYDNSAPDSPNFTNSHLQYSCTLPLPASGTGNITNAPLFRDAANGDFRLAPGSPCIDVGLDLGSGVTNDLAGNLRPLDGDGDEVAAFDLGALEFNPLTPTFTVNTSSNLVGDTSGLSAAASTNDLVNCAGPSCVLPPSLQSLPVFDPVPFMLFPGGNACSINNGNATTTSQAEEDGAYLPKTYGGGSLPCAVRFVLNTGSGSGTPNGYQITGIASFAGFHTNSRTLANQKFKVEYRAVGEDWFTSLGTFTYTPFATDNDGPSSALVSISTPGLVLAAHVQEIRLTYQDHGITPGGIATNIDGTVLKELDIFGFPSLVVSQPSPREIVQRDAEGRANIRIEGALGHAFTRVEARAVVMPGTGNAGVSTDWTNIVSTSGSNAFTGTLAGVTEGGWYQIEVRIYDGDLLLDEAVVRQVGVGDIFVTAGQSNAGCFGSPRQIPTDDHVSAYNLLTGSWQFAADPQPNIYPVVDNVPPVGPGGSPWPGLGSMLATDNRVPVGFVSLAYGGSAACQWLPGGWPPFYLPLYQSLTNALQRFGPNGVRCVLWHQGEADAALGTSSVLYEFILDTIIERSRHDAGWSVPWGIAEATYLPLPSNTMARVEAVAAGQRAVVYGNTNVFRGPRTDDFIWESRLAADGAHFNQSGLDEHARQWFQALEEPAGNVTVKNGDFENWSLSDGQGWHCLFNDIARPPAGWNLLGAAGTNSALGVCGFYNPNSQFYSGGGVLTNMSGPNVAFLFSEYPIMGPGDGFLQTLRAKLQPSTIYKLTVAIGVRLNLPAYVFGGYQVDLLTNGQPCSTSAGNLNTLSELAGGNPFDRFTDVSCTYTSPPSVAPSQQLAIRITKPDGYGTYLDFDNVRITNSLTAYGEFQSANWMRLTSPDSVPDADPDQDGYSNWDEFIAGTCPVSSNSVPRILKIVLAGSEVQVQVQTCAGSLYQLECSHGLPPGAWIPVGAAVTGNGGRTNLIDPDVSLVSQRFYRVRISR